MEIAVISRPNAASEIPKFFQIKQGHLVEEFGGFVESKSTMV